MPIKPSSIAVTIVALALIGCAVREDRLAVPEPRPLGREIPAYVPKETPAEPEFVEPSGVLTLRQALASALAANPRLAAFSWEVRALDAEALQAALLPNPELEAELEDFGGSGDKRGLYDAEATLRITQLIELGGKRSRRETVAELTRDLGGWDYETARLDVFTETTRAFITVVAVQERVSLREEEHRLAQETFDAVSERVEAGKVSSLERDRTQVLLSSSRISLERARGALRVAQQALAQQWGGEVPRFERATGAIYLLSPVPDLEDLLSFLSRNPDVARWDTELRLREADLELARSGAVPDLTGSVGVKRFYGPDEIGFVVGLGIDLPILNQNQGEIRAAHDRVARAVQERRSAVSSAAAALKIAWQELATSSTAAAMLKDDVLPSADRTFRGVQEAYQQGKAGYLEVLDAQAALVAARSEYLDSLEAFHTARVEVERQIAGPLAGDANREEGE